MKERVVQGRDGQRNTIVACHSTVRSIALLYTLYLLRRCHEAVTKRRHESLLGGRCHGETKHRHNCLLRCRCHHHDVTKHGLSIYTGGHLPAVLSSHHYTGGTSLLFFPLIILYGGPPCCSFLSSFSPSSPITQTTEYPTDPSLASSPTLPAVLDTIPSNISLGFTRTPPSLYCYCHLPLHCQSRMSS